MPVTSKDVHLLTHTARMLLVLEAKPKHVGGPEYKKQINAYARRWAELTKKERTEVLESAGEIHDMTEAALNAATAALEG